jgi:hypothetical protein
MLIFWFLRGKCTKKVLGFYREHMGTCGKYGKLLGIAV